MFQLKIQIILFDNLYVLFLEIVAASRQIVWLYWYYNVTYIPIVCIIYKSDLHYIFGKHMFVEALAL